MSDITPDELMRRIGSLSVAAADDTIKSLRAEVERLKAEAVDADHRLDGYNAMCAEQQARAEAAEKAMEEQDAVVDFIGIVACGMAFESGRIEVMNEHARTHSVCAFCGVESPRTPEAMEAHARACEKHPLSKALAEVARLKASEAGQMDHSIALARMLEALARGEKPEGLAQLELLVGLGVGDRQLQVAARGVLRPLAVAALVVHRLQVHRHLRDARVFSDAGVFVATGHPALRSHRHVLPLQVGRATTSRSLFTAKGSVGIRRAS